MVKKMKLPFLNKNTSSSSFSSNSSHSSSSWPWPSCNQQNPKKISSGVFFTVNKPKNVYEPEPHSRSFSYSSTTDDVMEDLLEIECIENVIRGLKSSKRLTFERIGESNSVLEEPTKKEEEEAHDEEEDFMLLSLESNDPYSDFKRSMENMVESRALHHDWRNLEKLLFLFLKVNVKTSHKYIFAAFVDLLFHLAVGFSKDVAGEPRPDIVQESPSSPISFYSSYSSSDDTSSTSLQGLPGLSIGGKSRDGV
ncbi:hypothetical protein EUTSA_v10011014mg [Eutrema salsugineum]|uniref:Transcription repressor n=1 Tax=Eutrema salsugineum TaxID=72664 RepID=V4LNB3_EUTSA|nr:transcription repressor OFP18 [Eutrema salsugineum]ESQ45249.1 hypothetical protein EUTSA_v10011014mg [Eutrema salsugineum]